MNSTLLNSVFDGFFLPIRYVLGGTAAAHSNLSYILNHCRALIFFTINIFHK